MNRRLWIRFALYFVTIAVLSILLVALISNYFVNRTFDEYVEANKDARNAQLAERLGKAYSDAGGWKPGLLRQIPGWATMMGVQLRIVTRDGRQVLDTASPVGGAGGGSANTQGDPVPIITTKQRYVAIAYISPIGRGGGPISQGKIFRQSTNNSLLAAGVIAAAIALLLSFVVSQRLVRPIQAVTAAVQAMEAGDLTHRVEVSGGDEVARLGHAFNRMADALAHQERLRKNLTADVAHELRTPLATIQSQVEAFQDGVMEADADNLESMHEEIVRLARLVGDLRQLSEAEGGTLTLATEPVDLTEFVGETLGGLEPRFDEESVELQTQLASEPQTALIDRDKMRQVIINLVSNALKFAPVDGWVRVSVATDGGFRAIAVTDNGAGIDEKDLPYIFERFFRADRSRSRATGGAGIGLAITKELVEAHGGRITVSSTVGQGTTFTVRLPAASAAENLRLR